MHSDAPITKGASGPGFVPLAPLLQAIAPERLDAARLRVTGLDRDKLVNKFAAAFSSGKRLAAFIMADELTERGIPPAFRHSHLAVSDYSINQKFDLMLYDLRWLRRAHPDHAKQVRYKRCRQLLTAGEPVFHREAEYMFYAGRRPAWKMVASLSVTEKQQWDCAWLRSAPVVKRHAAAQVMRDRVFKALEDDLRNVRRTKSFTDDDAKVTLLRRHALWVCSKMTNGSPAETAARYSQMTGKEITRDIVARQLQKVSEILAENDLQKTAKYEQEMV